MAKKFIKLGPTGEVFSLDDDESVDRIVNRFYTGNTFEASLKGNGDKRNALMLNPRLVPWMVVGED